MNPSTVLLAATGEWWSPLVNGLATPFVLIIVAMLTLETVKSMAKMMVRHRERMAMIERGMHPDHHLEPSNPPNES